MGEGGLGRTQLLEPSPLIAATTRLHARGLTFHPRGLQGLRRRPALRLGAVAEMSGL